MLQRVVWQSAEGSRGGPTGMDGQAQVSAGGPTGTGTHGQVFKARWATAGADRPAGISEGQRGQVGGRILVKVKRNGSKPESDMVGPSDTGSRGPLVGQLLVGALFPVFAALLLTACTAEEEARSPVSGPAGGTAEGASQTTSSFSTAELRKGDVVSLPAPRLLGELSLEEAIQGRRSIRDYSDEPVTLADAAQLLWAAQGVTSPQGARAAPSAGGTYPLELYLMAGKVSGLAPGVYRYRPQTHDLLVWETGDRRVDLAVASLNQAWVRTAALDVVVTAVYGRTMRTYGERGVRYVHLEAGHAAQNLCLQAVALDLGAVVVGAFYDEEVQAVVGLPEDHEPIYVIPVGHPAPFLDE